MEKKDVIEFFNRLATGWDDDMIRDDRKIDAIIDYGGVKAGKRVLDVACGTGVLFPDYLKRKVASITGVDISPEMAKIASGKFEDEKIEVICADVQELDFPEKFDCVMIYNAFPHFPKPEKLLGRLSECLASGGRITVAHGMSREKIDAHHLGSAGKVSVGLMPENELAELMGRWFNVDVVISDEEKFIVSGLKS